VSRRKTERLLNLVVCLLATRRYLTAEQIRRAVPGYPDSDEAFKRMFEATGSAGAGRRPGTGSPGRPTSCPTSI